MFPYIRHLILRAARNGVPTIEINPACTEISDVCRYRIPLGAAEAMTRIWARARGEAAPV
ncbi:MAG: hypothetical protein FJ276_23990 [Planctomycetes bacterium]|nr:hypothetical protein [Planctomycetota bacterium]